MKLFIMSMVLISVVLGYFLLQKMFATKTFTSNHLLKETQRRMTTVEHFSNPEIRSEPASVSSLPVENTRTLFEALMDGIAHHSRIHRKDYKSPTIMKRKIRRKFQQFLIDPSLFLRNLKRKIVVYGLQDISSEAFMKIVQQEVSQSPGRDNLLVSMYTPSLFLQNGRYPKINGKLQNIVSKAMLKYLKNELELFVKSLQDTSLKTTTACRILDDGNDLIKLQKNWMRQNERFMKTPETRSLVQKAYNYYITYNFLQKYQYVPVIGKMNSEQQKQFKILLQNMPKVDLLIQQYNNRCKKSIYERNFERVKQVHEQEMDAFFEKNQHFQWQTFEED